MHAGAIGALYGPLHGGANEAVLGMLQRIGHTDKIPAFIEGVKNRKEKLFGFGHRCAVHPHSSHLLGVANCRPQPRSELLALIGASPPLPARAGIAEQHHVSGLCHVQLACV